MYAILALHPVNLFSEGLALGAAGPVALALAFAVAPNALEAGLASVLGGCEADALDISLHGAS